jgi:hypothetical protein
MEGGVEGESLVSKERLYAQRTVLASSDIGTLENEFLPERKQSDNRTWLAGKYLIGTYTWHPESPFLTLADASKALRRTSTGSFPAIEKRFRMLHGSVVPTLRVFFLRFVTLATSEVFTGASKS